MAPYILALLIGVIAGLRAMTAPAAISWAARLGFLHLDTTPLAFLGYAATPYIVTLLAVVELVTDQLPSKIDRIMLSSQLPSVIVLRAPGRQSPLQ